MPVVDQAHPCILLGEGQTKKDVASNLLELEVHEDSDLAGVFRVKLAIIRAESGLWTLLDEGQAKPWQKLEIMMNVGDVEEQVMKGYVTQVRIHVDSTEGNSYLELVGMDATCLMSAEEVIKDWPGKSDSDIATELFTKYNLSSTVQSTGVVHEEKFSTILQRESDIQFLKRLARRNGFECVVAGDTGYFQKPNLDSTPLPELAAHFGKDTNLTSFEGNWNALLPTAVEVHQIDVGAKSVLDVAVEKSSQPDQGKDGPQLPPLPRGKTPRMFVRHGVFTGQPEMKNQADALADEADWFIEARGEVDTQIYGTVLHARKRVPVKGVGTLFSGIYYLTSVKHFYTPDRYIQNFTARRNATGPKPKDFKAAGPNLPI
jgi:phage protein D